MFLLFLSVSVKLFNARSNGLSIFIKSFFANVRVYHCRFRFCMAQKFLNITQINPIFILSRIKNIINFNLFSLLFYRCSMIFNLLFVLQTQPNLNLLKASLIVPSFIYKSRKGLFY